jgi:hypothetical protein
MPASAVFPVLRLRPFLNLRPGSATMFIAITPFGLSILSQLDQVFFYTRGASSRVGKTSPACAIGMIRRALRSSGAIPHSHVPASALLVIPSEHRKTGIGGVTTVDAVVILT